MIMKKILTQFQLPAVLTLAVSFSSCVPIDPGVGGGYGSGYGGGGYSGGGYSGGYAPPPSYRDRYSPDDQFGPKSYEKGYSCGVNDGRSGSLSNPSRHRGEYNERYEDSFIQGYREGYTRGRQSYQDQDRAHDHDRDHGSNQGSNGNWGGPDAWYRSGYNLGKQDRRDGVSSNYSRHSRHYDGKTRAQFARGYEDGYRR
jgi:hypothetical protein